MLHFSYIWASHIFLIEWQIIMKNDEYENDVFNFINHIEKSLIQTNSYHIALLLICGMDLKLNIIQKHSYRTKCP
jgi:hypothetical protein